MTAAALLPDGRLHLHHGPIDLLVTVEGPEGERLAALRQAARRFEGLLEGLVAELPRLRAPLDPARPLTGPVARRMAAAVAPHAGVFVTPMAAVAGAVADEVLAATVAGRSLRRAHVNNGGDAAIFLAPGETLSAAIFARPEAGADAGRAVIRAGDGVGGLATSGWRGRSWSLGIADAVTVLAPCAAAADAAATLIANAVDLPGHSAIRRGPARTEDPDSDLGDRRVTLGVGPLTPTEARRALAVGAAAAEAMRARGLIVAASLILQGEARVAGSVTPSVFPAEAPAHA